MSQIRIDSSELNPARVDGNSQNAFKTTKLILVKPRWVTDESSSVCVICNSKFNQIRRKHHCRCCGKVFCSKCCSNKVPIPQYMIDTVERVCNACLPVVSCVTMSHSSDDSYHHRAVIALEAQCRDKPASVIALGGAHVLVYLTKIKHANSIETLNHITASLHTLSMHAGAIKWLSDIGVVDALCHILNLSTNEQGQTMMTTEALNTLRIFVKTNDAMKRKVVNTGCLTPLFKLCECGNPFISLVAMTTLCLIAECSNNHRAILEEKNSLRKLLTKVSDSKDEKEIEIILRIILLMSAGDDETKHLIVCEDSSLGSVLSQLFKTRSSNHPIISNAAGAIANLSTSEQDQMGLQSSLQAILSVINEPFPSYISVHLVRAIGNFAKHEIHSNTILPRLSDIMKFLSVESGYHLNSYVVKTVVNLMKHRKGIAVDKICRIGAEDFLLRLCDMESVMHDLLRSLDHEASSIAV